MLILGQKDCILGPTFFKIPQPKGHYSTHYIHETSKLRQIFRGKIPLFLVLYVQCTYMLKFSTKAANENILAYVDDPISLVST